MVQRYFHHFMLLLGKYDAAESIKESMLDKKEDC